MELIYAVQYKNQYVVYKNGLSIHLLSPGAEVNHAYGFESPEDDNQWILDHCGIGVYRKYIYFTNNYCVAVFEPVSSAILNDGFEWISEEQLARIASEKVNALLLAHNGSLSKTAPWMNNNGSLSKTAPWMNNNGIIFYLNWAKAALEEQGGSVRGAIRQIRNTYISSVFRIQTNAGAIYLKISSSVYVNNVVMEQELTGFMGAGPVFVAVSPDSYAALTKEMDGYDCRPNNYEQYKSCLNSWGKKQTQTVGENIYGLHDCSPQGLLAECSQLERKINYLYTLTGRQLSGQDLFLLHEKLAKSHADLKKLCTYPIPNALCHADIRPGNVRIMNDAAVLYDWGLAFYGHPFYDAMHSTHVVRRQITKKQKASLLEAYLNNWQHYGNKQMLFETYAQAEQCSDFFMLAADCRWLFCILDICGGIPLNGTIDDWLFNRRFYYFDRVLQKYLTK